MSAAAHSGPRAVALAVIRRVVEHGGYSNLALSAALERSRLTGGDRSLAAELAYGTLRRLGSLDWALSPIAHRPLDEANPRARALLRLGAYQILFTRIPAHAAVSETVSLAGSRDRAFVNAVLRRLAAEPPEWPQGDGDAEVAVRTGLSGWAVGELRHLLGEEAEEVEEASRALATETPLSLRANTCRASVDELEAALSAAGVASRRGGLHPDTLLIERAPPGGPSHLPGFREGWFVVQDQASAVVVSALDPRPGERVLDACAAPGGKAGHIACLVGPQGSVIGADLSPGRAGIVLGNARRLGLPILVLAQDARRPALRGLFDRVLVDAPCSGIGAARRRPELLWRPGREDLSRLARLQVAIATSAADMLLPGGRLVYSVCTFPRAETDAACDAILRKRPDLEPVALEGPDGPESRFRLWPHRHGTDAMFVAGFRRRRRMASEQQD